MMLLILTLLLLPALSTAQQRPSHASLCDYYATQRYGSNSTANQVKLLESIFALALAGGSTLENASDQLTGILNPGTFAGNSVNLVPYFDGTLPSTNLNNQPVAIDWLDGGSIKDIFTSFLTGQTSSMQFVNGSNEARVFSNFLIGFNDMFNCSVAPADLGSDRPLLDIAFVHKFMDLNQTDIGYFLNQVILATDFFGFSQEDSDYISNVFNGQYNVRCAAPVGTQLYSLCQNPSCPLAVIPDCDAYLPSNLGPSGAISTLTVSTSVSQYDPFQASTVSVIAPSAATLASASTSLQTTNSSPSASPSPSPPPKRLGAGAVAGVTIGGMALAFLIGLAIVFLLRKMKNSRALGHELSAENPSYVSGHVDPQTGQVARELGGVPISELP